MNVAAIVMGGSAGGFTALDAILPALPADFALPVLVVEHLHTSDEGLFAVHLRQISVLPVTEAGDKTAIEAGHIYIAPANYHLLVEDGATLALSVDPPVNYSRPAIDVLFDSAARVWGDGLIAVLLSGASNDGTAGLAAVKAAGGHAIVQEPASAEFKAMPRSAIDAGLADEVLAPARIAARLTELASKESST